MFRDRFDRTFGLASKGYGSHDVRSAQELLASTLGGVGYFFGRSLVGSVDDPDAEADAADALAGPLGDEAGATEPRGLLTATPSRPFFPRGFYWDEGFHLLLIARWDRALALAILRDWLSLANDDGWIAREQILGDEARSKVPERFRMQFRHHANPPTLALALAVILADSKAPAPASADESADAALPSGIPAAGATEIGASTWAWLDEDGMCSRRC